MKIFEEFKINKSSGSFSTLLGFPAYGEDYPEPGISGHYRFWDESGVFDGEGMALKKAPASDGQERFVFESGVSALDMTFSYFPDCEVYRLACTVVNKTKTGSSVRCARLRFALAGEDWEAYTQSSGWCRENQGGWQPLISGVTAGCQGLRSSEGATPMLALRNTLTKEGIAFHLLPMGRWRMDANKKTNHNGKVYTVVELGQDDAGLRLCLEPEESLNLPDILMHTLDPADGPSGLSEHKIQAYALKHAFKPREIPFVYNSWFYDFDRIDYQRFLEQARTASKLGCEAFVVDAGWFGTGRDWGLSVGDWSERTEGAFLGRMKAFAGEIRSMGMLFGLWMEPERASPDSKAAMDHPEYFIAGDSGFLVLNFARQDAREFIFMETCRLIETYGAGMMKIDFNTGISLDAEGSGFYRYYEGFASYMGALKEKYPHVFFEGCSSGGLRSDIKTMSLFDSHFLSDTVNPTEHLRILQGALMRLPVSSLSKWAVFRGASSSWRPYGKSAPDKSFALVCGDAKWEKLISMEPSFVMASLIGGACGLGGDIGGLSDEIKATLSLYVQRAIEERPFFLMCVTRSLALPSSDIRDTRTPIIWQHSSLRSDRSIVAGYCLEGGRAHLIRPRGLKPEKLYQVRDYLTKEILFYQKGAELALDIRWDRDFQCKAFILEEKGC